ncbi:hypothetical protein V2P16_18470, partial [Acinetobacter pittii]
MFVTAVNILTNIRGMPPISAPEPADYQPRPQTLLLMLLGDFVLDRDVCVFSGSVIDTLARL